MAANNGGYTSIATRRTGYRVRYADVNQDTPRSSEDMMTER